MSQGLVLGKINGEEYLIEDFLVCVEDGFVFGDLYEDDRLI